jgi:hypothetical protein
MKNTTEKDKPKALADAGAFFVGLIYKFYKLSHNFTKNTLKNLLVYYIIAMYDIYIILKE